MCWISAYDCINLTLSSSVLFIQYVYAFEKIKINYAPQWPSNAASRSMSDRNTLRKREEKL